MSRRSNIRKRQRQKRRHAQRPQPEVTAKEAATPQVVRVKTADLIEDILARTSSLAFSAALQETTKTS
jgi:hypothetical protein